MKRTERVLFKGITDFTINNPTILRCNNPTEP